MVALRVALMDAWKVERRVGGLVAPLGHSWVVMKAVEMAAMMVGNLVVLLGRY